MLELVDLDGGYDDTIVLRDINLFVPPSSVVALLGPNGAGKTTLLRMASGLLTPRRGQVFLEDDDITGLRPNQRMKMGICHIPEGRGIFPSLSVRENLIMHSLKGEEKDAIERAAEVFPILGERLSQQAGTLSGGQQQMLAIIRAYIQNPKVVLVDEASLGLAPVIVDGIFEFLGELAKKGVALLIVEQYVARALALADKVYLLNHGRITFEGEPSELEDEAVFASYMGGEVGSH
ncbi:MAG: ABC transporter ATP-binding protein [Acidobacteria bacterium]|nr:ABC transporter ATP-binding protein [Acidobacteriota bacterium]